MAVRTDIRKWEDLDIRSLAGLTSEVRRLEGLGDYTAEQVESYIIDMNKRFPIEIAVVALDGKRIVGWIALERTTENIGEIGRWYPFVANDVDRTYVARALISEVISYARTHDITRIEVAFGGISDENLESYKQRCEWYKLEGWKKLEDSYFMQISPSGFQNQEVELPKGYKTRPLIDIENVALFKVYHDSFMTGAAKWIHDLTLDERRQEFEKIFASNHQINEPASFVIESGDEIVGYVLVISRSDGEEHIESIAVLPSARGKGLAKYMVGSVLKTLKAQSVTNLTLGTDPENVPAITLYKKIGFETVSRTARYSWKESTA